MKNSIFSRLFYVALASVLVVATGCQSMMDRMPFAPRNDATVARLNYSVQQNERDMARLKARIEAQEKEMERLEARIIAAESQAREVARLRTELGDYRNDLRDARVEIPRDMSVAIKKMLDENQTQTLAQVQRAVNAARPAPTSKQSGFNHTVAPNQTLSLIAREYKTTVDAIMKANNLKSANQIRVGQVLFVPAD